ncbi:MAG: peptidase M20 [Proteobacteria bacterium]|nr:MAG: peptidase M20 [Pseudomonadota bacterium]
MAPSPAQTGAVTEPELSRAAKQDVARIASLAEVHSAMAWFRSHARDVTEEQLQLTKIPAPPFGEHERAEWLRQRFSLLGLTDVHIDEIGNVVGLRPGVDPKAKKVLAISAHIDTVFPDGTPLKVRREADRLFGPGISDNGAGLTGLLAVAEALNAADVQTQLPILFVGNVGEEGEGDVRGMRYLFGESDWGDAIQYTLILDGAGTDSIVTQALGSKRFQITVNGPGGHSWSDFGIPNPIVALARAIEDFSHVSVPADPKTTFNIGIISGGTSVNSIPETATMKVDLRSASADEITKLEKQLRVALDQSIMETSISPRRRRDGQPVLSYEMKLIGNRPAAELKPNSRLLAVVQAVDQQLGNNARLQRASTDANIPLSMGKEAVAMGAGGSGGGAHTLHEWFDSTNRELGLKRILLSAVTLAGVAPAPKKK